MVYLTCCATRHPDQRSIFFAEEMAGKRFARPAEPAAAPPMDGQNRLVRTVRLPVRG